MYDYDEHSKKNPVEAVTDGIDEDAWEPYEDEAEDIEDFV